MQIDMTTILTRRRVAQAIRSRAWPSPPPPTTPR